MKERLKEYWSLQADQQDLLITRRHKASLRSVDSLEKVPGRGMKTISRRVNRVAHTVRSS